MRAFHSNWTGPFFKKNPKGHYEIEDFELLTTILSALKWQACNGDIQMITDECGADYYRSLGLETLWNLGIDDSLEAEMADDINATDFWAAGKLYALAKQKTPCVMLDTDFIVWEDMTETLSAHEVTVIHKEELDPGVYPEPAAFRMAADYTYPPDWDWAQLPCNTAFTFFNNVAFKDYYVSEAIRFMQGAQGGDPLIYMVFAEQRLLSMCAEEKGVELFALSNTDSLFNSRQQQFTHVWGHKRYLRAHPEARVAFCKRCIARVQKDHPAFYPILTHMQVLQPYF